MFQWSVREIHLPQILNEEAIADEFSKWEQVSSVAAERFAHAPSTSAPPGTLLLSLTFIEPQDCGRGRGWQRKVFSVSDNDNR